MAQKKITIEVTQKELSNFIYAVSSARELVNSHEFPSTAQQLQELEDFLSRAGK
jgi:hypothetical protein